MSRFTSKDLHRVELDEGDWVQLRTLTFGDRQAIQQVLLKTRTNKELGFDGVDLDMAAANTEMMRRSIVHWGGPGFGCDCGAKESPHAAGCKVEPVSIENINQLDTTGDKLVDEIGVLQAGASDPKAQKTRARKPKSGSLTSQEEDPRPVTP